MTEQIQLAAFRIETQRYALSLDVVEHVVRAVAVTDLPSSPRIVLGVINVRGRIIPVLNTRQRFGLPAREISPEDFFLLARTHSCAVALVIDEPLGVLAMPAASVVDSRQIVPGLGHVRGVIKLEEGLVLIHDLEAFLSLDEARALDEAMTNEVTHGR